MNNHEYLRRSEWVQEEGDLRQGSMEHFGVFCFFLIITKDLNVVINES